MAVRVTLEGIKKQAKILKCSVDDILDAISLAITGNLVMQGKYEVIPEKPMMDETGLLMQMVIPDIEWIV